MDHLLLRWKGTKVIRPGISLLALVGATCIDCAPAVQRAEPQSGLQCPAFVTASNGLPEVGEWRTHPATGDINKDGLDDIVVLGRKEAGPRAFLSDGLGNWVEASEGLRYESGFGCGVGTRLVDLDGDGWLDMVAADHCTGLWVWRGDGGSSWTVASRGIPRNIEGVNDVDAGDIDEDGQLDIVAISAFDGGFIYMRGLGDGQWQPQGDVGLPRTGSGWQIDLLDIDHNGRLDVIASFNPVTTNMRIGKFPPAKVWLQGIDGRFRPSTGFGEDGRWFGFTALSSKAGKPPPIVFGLYGFLAGLYVYRSDDGTDWTSVGRIDQPWFGERVIGYAGVTSGDFNRDGFDDLVLSESATRDVWLALGDQDQRWYRCPAGTLSKEGVHGQNWGVSTGDFNGDGLLDIVAAFGTNGRGVIRAWFQTERHVPLDPDHGQGLSASKSSLGSGAPTPKPEP